MKAFNSTEGIPASRFSSEHFFREMLRNNPHQIIARDQQQLDQVFGGMVNARTLANADSLGAGPKEKIRMGRKVGYTLRSLVAWVLERVEEAERNPPVIPQRKPV